MRLPLFTYAFASLHEHVCLHLLTYSPPPTNALVSLWRMQGHLYLQMVLKVASACLLLTQLLCCELVHNLHLRSLCYEATCSVSKRMRLLYLAAEQYSTLYSTLYMYIETEFTCCWRWWLRVFQFITRDAITLFIIILTFPFLISLNLSTTRNTWIMNSDQQTIVHDIQPLKELNRQSYQSMTTISKY